MPSFSQESLDKLNTCHPDLQIILNEVIKHFDCKVLCGHRNKQEQDKAYRNGFSKVRWPNSKHNTTPSMAVDVAPYVVDYNDRERITYFAGYVMAIALSLGINLRWGGDWDMDTQVNDNAFDDLVHFELVTDGTIQTSR